MATTSNPKEVTSLNKEPVAYNWMGYAIAGITLGAAFGNMFLAGKMRNVMNAKMPKIDPFKASSSSSNSARSAHSSPFGSKREFYSRSQHYSGFNPYENGRKVVPDNRVVPDKLIPHLIKLELPLEFVDEQQIKQAYRAAAMKYHPDRVEQDDTELKQLCDTRFKGIQESYNVLLKELSEKRISM